MLIGELAAEPINENSISIHSLPFLDVTCVADEAIEISSYTWSEAAIETTKMFKSEKDQRGVMASYVLNLPTIDSSETRKEMRSSCTSATLEIECKTS